MEKILLIDKSPDWTSFDVVAKLRGILKKNTGQKIKVGHAGTLDPFATGLLIILIGNETKNQNQFMKLDKEYEAVFHLGATSNTDDLTGEITPCHSEVLFCHSERSEESPDPSATPQDDKPSLDQIEKALGKFRGEQLQVPPKYSAIKVEGKRAYKLARKEADFEIEPRKVTIYDIELLGYEYPLVKLRINCSSGTYIRSLARDLGELLGCGAYVESLRRTRIGDYRISDAEKIEELSPDHLCQLAQ